MKILLSLLSWVIGIVILSMGLMLLRDSVMASLLLLLAGLFVFPPARSLAAKYINSQLPLFLRVPVVVTLLFIAMNIHQGDVIGPAFESNRADIISAIKSDIANKDYDQAMSALKKYSFTDDREIASLRQSAETELETIEAAEAAAKQAQKAVPKSRQSRIELQFSGWDGSHRTLEQLIKRSMNDPASYDHVETAYSDQGDHLVVVTSYRGKNAFGGVVKQTTTAKVSVDGEIFEIIK